MRGERDNPIGRIAKRFGSTSAMARMVGVGQATAWDWVAKGFVPSHRIPEIIEAGQQMTPPIVLEPNDFFVDSGSKEQS